MDHPELGRVIEGEVRRYLLRGFPFALFYVPSDDEIVVLACLHGASDPNTWPSSGAA
jgi:plasmid stabilization system protein ParE